MEDSTILSTKNLKIAFEKEGTDREVIHGIDFNLNKGEVLGIVGESGSGKSITCLSILKLLPAKGIISEGAIHYKNKEGNTRDIISIGEDDMPAIRGKEVSMIFQEPMTSLNPTQRCGRQVEEAILVHYPEKKGSSKAEVIALFQKVNLPEPERIYESYPHQLSGGQLQRVMISMAVANHPSIIIADEPTTALDVTVQKQIIKLLKEIKEEYACSIIFISHDLGLIKQICDRVIVMKEGEIVEQGDIQPIFNSPSHPYTAGLLACRPPLDQRYHRLPTVDQFLNLDKSKHQAYLDSLIESKQQFDERQLKLADNDVILSVEKLSKYYTKKKSFFGKPISFTKAVEEVSFEMKKGEILGLVGESGSGKSTLGKAILKLIAATSGKVVFEGKSVFDMDKESLRKMRKDFQIIFQDPYSSLNPKMKIGRAIMEPMEVHKLFNTKAERKQKAISLLETVGLLPEHFDRYPHEFSGGQRQRICIARTLSLNPKFIVCDESVSALDVSVQAQVLNLLKDLKDKFDLSYLFISHDLSVIKFFCDNVLVMKDGKIKESGNVEEVFSNPKSDYTKKLIAAIPN
jgi:peptide/nickel transport system ATP-binding protein